MQKARAALLLYAHNRGAAETLGMTESDLNKKLRSWSNYSSKARDISMQINSSADVSNRWTGIENMSYIMRATVNQDELARMVKSVEGESSEYERNYIARTMLALDTHIDWSELSFKFVTHAEMNNGNPRGGVRGNYIDGKRLINVQHDAPNTVAHEMGHALDRAWGRKLGSNLGMT